MRSASFSASARSWVVSRTVVSSRSARAWTRSWKSLRAFGSKPVVGSSRKSRRGRPTIPTATSSRRRWPPESAPTRVSALSESPTRASSSATSYGPGYPSRPAYGR